LPTRRASSKCAVGEFLLPPQTTPRAFDATIAALTRSEMSFASYSAIAARIWIVSRFACGKSAATNSTPLSMSCEIKATLRARRSSFAITKIALNMRQSLSASLNCGRAAKLVERLAKGNRTLSFCYEAGPCGYGLFRQLVALGHDCMVAAPSLIPMKAGDRVKTDRRDAVMLAKLHRAGELTAVWVPDDAHEAMRDLIRARATAVRVLSKARQHVAQQLVLQDYIHTVTDAEARVERLLRQIEDIGQNWSQAPVVAALQAMRGVAFIVAVTLVAEVGDFSRFANPRQLMAYLGLLHPSTPADAPCIGRESPRSGTHWRDAP
jgi:hypothetical protein